MGKKSGKKHLSCFSIPRSSKLIPLPPSPSPPISAPAEAPAIGKGAKKKTGIRLWLRYDREGRSETMELDKGAIIKLAGIPTRDLRILGPVFSQSSNILEELKKLPAPEVATKYYMNEDLYLFETGRHTFSNV